VRTERLTSYTNDGLTFDVSDTGPVDGPRVVLLHGFPQRATCWEGVTRALNRWGYRTFAPDQRGYSPQARPRTRASYRLGALVEDVRALIGAVPGPVHLVGHDWGAAVAWTLAAEHPAELRSLVSVSVPHPRAYVRSLLTSTQAARSWYAAAFQVPLVPEATARLLPALVETGLRRSGMPEPAVERVRREVLDDGALGPALGYYRAFGLGGTGGPVQRVQVPTTHVWSDGDAALTRAGAERTGEYVDAPYRLVVLPGLSHWIPDEAPEQLAQIIDQRADRLR
jgi:pimeloyl-ACP methyl ester carboxylesterase